MFIMVDPFDAMGASADIPLFEDYILEDIHCSSAQDNREKHGTDRSCL